MNQQDLNRYAGLMDECRKRVSVLHDFFGGKCNTTYVRTNTESMCLQLRKTLELVAFSTLVSHRDAYQSIRQDIAKDWHATRILNAVEGLNPNFFPKPVRGWTGPNSRGRHTLVRLRGGYLNRRQFAKLYDDCGGMLHSTNPFDSERSFRAFSDRLPSLVERLTMLMKEHMVALAQSDDFLWVHVPMNLQEPVVVLKSGRSTQ